ncbi:MAG: S4 domain-containing protein [Pseudothermotoga sp.]
MRIDKYLKTTGLIKRRTVAQQMLLHGKVLVNNRQVKPSYEVKAGEILKIIHPFKELTVRVVSDSEYEILSQSKIENL